MSLVSPLLALIYQARSRGVHLRLQVSFPDRSLLRTAGLRTFLASRRLLRQCQLAGRGCIFMGLLSSWTPGRLIRRSRGVTPSSSAHSGPVGKPKPRSTGGASGRRSSSLTLVSPAARRRAFREFLDLMRLDTTVWLEWQLNEMALLIAAWALPKNSAMRRIRACSTD